MLILKSMPGFPVVHTSLKAAVFAPFLDAASKIVNFWQRTRKNDCYGKEVFWQKDNLLGWNGSGVLKKVIYCFAGQLHSKARVSGWLRFCKIFFNSLSTSVRLSKPDALLQNSIFLVRSWCFALILPLFPSHSAQAPVSILQLWSSWTEAACQALACSKN